MTACDASEAMADLASLYIGRPVLRMSFEQVPFREHFDGVWACASLLHVPRHRMIGTLDRLGAAMKAGGAMYASFRYGRGVTIRDGRLFSDHNEESLEGLLRNSPELEICEAWRTTDLRTDHSDVRWLNALLRKR